MTSIGVDVGTSVAKAALLDDDGAALVVEGRELELLHGEGGAVEQDLAAILELTGEVVRAVAARGAADGHPVPDLLAVTGQGDGCWLLAEDGSPARNGMSWLDGRAGDLLGELAADGVVEKVYAINGTTLFPGAPGPLLAWLDRHEPDTLARTATVGSCTDGVFTALTGERVTDPSDSSMPFGDGTGTGWSDDVLSLLGIGHRRDLLPPIATPLPTAELTDAGARLTGLPAGTAVVKAPFDFPSCGIGGGVEEVGDGLLIIGTTLGCLVHVDHLTTDGEPAGFHVATGTEGRWQRAMPAMVGTACMDWLLRTLGIGVDAIEPALATSPPGANGVEVLPYFATSGERAPFVDPRARGQLSGVRLTTTHDDLVRGVCEGLAYAARHCFEVAGHDGRVVAAGGGSASPSWLQVFADVLGTPVHLARSPEVGARGAVIAARRALGHQIDAGAWTRPEGRVDPDPGRQALHDEGYRRYLDHVEAARPFWARQSRLETVEREPVVADA